MEWAIQAKPPVPTPEKGPLSYSPYRRMLLLLLAREADTATGEVFPKWKELSRQTQLSPRWIRENFNFLIDVGLVEKIGVCHDGTGRYRIGPKERPLIVWEDDYSGLGLNALRSQRGEAA